MALIQTPGDGKDRFEGGDRWYVSDGETVVGPVPTRTLLKGITHGRVPESCWVRQPAWRSWRPLTRLREFTALDRAPVWADAVIEADDGDLAIEQLTRAQFLGEAFLHALAAIMARTGADVGLVHRIRAPFIGLVTSAAQGPGASELLGEVVPAHDASLHAAQAGLCALGSAGDGEAEAAVARRFDVHVERNVRGVIMVPVRAAEGLMAMIELARFDHPFRERDLLGALEITRATMARLADLVRSS